MKTVLTKFLAISSMGLLMLASCKKQGTEVVSNGGKPGALSANTTNLALDRTMVNDTTTVIKFNFSKATFNFSAAVTNVLQIDAQGDNWVNPTTFTLGTGVYSQGFSTAAFNALVLKLNLPAGTASQVNVRVANTLATNVPPVYTNTLSLTVTPFNLTSWVYAVGAYQGWNIGNQDSLISVTGNGIYTGILNFTATNNQFLLTPVKGSYNNKYATTDATTQTTATVTQNAANNLSAPTTAGQYIVTFNSNTNTISFALANSYSVIGDAALGWNATGDDTPMKYINDLNQTWVSTLPLVSTGSFKIRQNDDWTFSWGVPKNSSDAGFGVANTLNDTENNNISVAASGTYTVSFNIPITAVGTTPAVTATYNTVKQ